jgi:hypothetical protein
VSNDKVSLFFKGAAAFPLFSARPNYSHKSERLSEMASESKEQIGGIFFLLFRANTTKIFKATT